jgi:protein SCO1/2
MKTGMNRNHRNAGAAACLLLFGLASPAGDASQAAMHDHHAHHMHAMQQERVRTVKAYDLPDIPLVGMDRGKTSLRAELDSGQPVMLNFIFTSCTAICPVMSATFSQVQKALGTEREKLRLVSISIDPEYDTPERLKAYAAKFGAGPEWRFLTGTPADVVAIERAFDAYRGGKMNHMPLTLLRAAPGAPWVRLDGFASAEDLVREYRALAAK